MKQLVVCLSVIVMSGCSSNVAPVVNKKNYTTTLPTNEIKENFISSYKGTVVSSFEGLFFKPIGIEERWWINDYSKKYRAGGK
jgi:PBP1b-binding outer membrane lipoprotein LpoB